MGNSLFEERWRLLDMRLQSCRKSREWMLGDEEIAATEAGWSLKVTEGREHPCESPSLRAELFHNETARYRFKIFPEVAGAIMEDLRPGAATASAESEKEADGIEREVKEENSDDGLALAGTHLLVTEVHLAEQTDRHSNFVAERKWQTHPSEGPLFLRANLMTVEDPATGEGIVFLLLGPTRLVREGWSGPCDFRIETVHDKGGLPYTTIFVGPTDYPVARLLYTGGRAGRAAVLHELQRAFHEPQSGRDGLLLSNTWGDRGRADRLSEEFMLREIEAARELGVEVVQIDDGWQHGRSANTVASGGVWNGFWSVPDFWEHDARRFPHGLGVIRDAAAQAGMKLGLWYAPDSTGEMEHWEKDAALVLRYWKELGVCHFKLDAIKLNSRRAEERLHAFLDRVHRESGGAVLFDLDVTAEHRLAYWGHLHGSALFLENRYTDRGSYFPHQTLRAVWNLAWYVRPSRLRLEFLNPARNPDRYGNDPLRPSAYAPECLFAITMMASPLAWLENSGLEAETRRRMGAMVEVWKAHRTEWQCGRVLPIGEEPDGFSWTGFVSTGAGATYLLVFRELHESPIWSLAGPERAGGSVEGLAGEGSAEIKDGRIFVTIPQKLGFFFARLPRIG